MPEHPKKLLQRFGLEARKSLGQNFLLPGAGERIASAAGIRKGDAVLEIGPGLGALTEALLDRDAKVIAVDLDAKMISILRELFAGRENLELVHGDARDFDIGGTAARYGKLKLVGNLPYYASSPILRRAVDERAHLISATFTLQKEVADRIAAGPGSKTYGSLSVLIGLYAHATVAMKLPPGAFHPQPGVVSAVLHLVFLEKPRAEVADFPWFEKIVFAAFSHRRKTILNSMKDSLLEHDGAAILAALSRAEIDPQRRAETVSVEEFARLAKEVPRA